MQTHAFVIKEDFSDKSLLHLSAESDQNALLLCVNVLYALSNNVLGLQECHSDCLLRRVNLLVAHRLFVPGSPGSYLTRGHLKNGLTAAKNLKFMCSSLLICISIRSLKYPYISFYPSFICWRSEWSWTGNMQIREQLLNNTDNMRFVIFIIYGFIKRKHINTNKVDYWGVCETIEY